MVTQEARFNTYYTRYKEPIRKRIAFILRCNQELVEEVEQETWLKIWRKFPTSETIPFFWFSRIATNAAIDAIREKYHVNTYSRRAVLPPASLDENPSWYTSIESHACDLDEQAAQREEITTLLAQVAPDRREIFLFFANGSSYEDILAHTEYSAWQIYNAIRFVREKARAYRRKADVS